MSYTLVSAAVLGYELARIPAGPALAHTLLTGLTADSPTLFQLATSGRPRRSTHPRDRAPLQLRSLPEHISTTDTLGTLTATLDATRLDDTTALDRLIRTEVLGPDSPAAEQLGPDLRDLAADVLVELATAAWASHGEDPHDPLSSDPTSLGLPATPVGPGELGPHGAAVLAVLGSLDTRQGRTGWAGSRAADPAAWSTAMHQACWAAHLSGRVRAAACAQLRGVLAFRAAGFGPDEIGDGVWNAYSGVLQATVVSDLLDEPSRTTLMAPATTSPPQVIVEQ